jgi:uncharacterized protein YrrD
MRIDIGASVFSNDGRNLGAVDRLIVDPNHNEVIAAVIRKGLLLPRDIEVPSGSIRQSSRGDLTIDLSADEVKNLPEFQEAVYIAPPADYQLAPGYSPGSVYWPVGMVTEAPRNAPTMPPDPDPTMRMAVENEARAGLSREELESAVIGKGSTVTGRDGKSVGKVEELAFDGRSGKLAGLVVRSGLLMHTDRRVDASLIGEVEEGVIHLKIDSDQLPV